MSSIPPTTTRRGSSSRCGHAAPAPTPRQGAAWRGGRALTAPLKREADHVIDTTDSDVPALQQQIRDRFASGDESPTLTIMSFGFARGLPRNADLVLDMRFLRNPHWQEELRDLTGLDPAVGAHIAGDDFYEDAMARIEDLLLTLLPRYRAEGKSYVSVAFGCTGGRHRSVHVAERVAARLRAAGFSPSLDHRELATPPRDGIERSAGAETLGQNEADGAQGE